MTESFWDHTVQQEEVVEERKEYLILKKLMGYWYIPVALVIGMILSKTLLFLVVLLLMIGACVGVSAYRLFVPFNVGIELISFFSIAVSAAVSPVFGAVIAVASVFISHTIYNNHCAFMFVKMAAYGGLCFLVGFFEPAGIFGFGMILVLIRNAIFLLMTFFMNPKRLLPDVPGMIINIFLNMWLFATFGTWMVGVLT